MRGGAVARMSAPSPPIWIWERATDPPSKKHKSRQKFCQIEKTAITISPKVDLSLNQVSFPADDPSAAGF